MFDWNDLKIFLAVAHGGSTLGAAKALGVNQTTVARRITALEEATGLKLFDRRQDGYRLCEAGEALLGPALQVQEAVLDVECVVGQQQRDLTGSVSVTTTETLAVGVLTPWLADFMDLYPEIRVEMIASEKKLDLAAGEADLALRAQKQPEDAAGVVMRRLCDSPWGVYCSAIYAARRGAPRDAEELKSHSIIGYDGPFAEIDLIKAFMEAAPPANIRSKCVSVIHMLAAVRAGHGIGTLPCSVANQEPDLIECFRMPDLGYAIYLITNAAVKDIPRVRALSDFIVARSIAERHLLDGGPPRQMAAAMEWHDPGL